MNINDYQTLPIEQDHQTRVEYVRDDYGLDTRYPANSTVSIKGRRDFEGVIDRIEGNGVVVKMFGETYSIPHQTFDSIFYIHPVEKRNWYEKLKTKDE